MYSNEVGFLSEIPPWWDVAWSTWALVIVGLGGTAAAIWTLITIRRQTTAIERRVREMQNTSLQTDRLIEEATKQSIAAKKSAEALVNTERAWIMVELDWVPGYNNIFFLNSSETGSQTSAAIRFLYTNEGKTIAWIDERLACFQIVTELPKQPDFSALKMLDCEPEWVGVKDGGQLDETLEAEGREDVETFRSFGELSGIEMRLTPSTRPYSAIAFAWITDLNGSQDFLNTTRARRPRQFHFCKAHE